ncbi:MAG: thiamine phosphate synthase [Pseudomonadota bacterium]
MTPEHASPGEFLSALENALMGGPVACLQLRLKGQSDADILAMASAVKPLCDANDVALVVNDRADLAKRAGADAVHLGQSDGDLRAARDLLGNDVAVGVTCHASRHLAMKAGEAGADYVAFGAFFDSPTKTSLHRPAPEILTWWTSISELPCVAIGGITPENCAPLVAAGADMLAVSSAVWDHKVSPEAAVRDFHEAMEANAPEVKTRA